MKVRAKMHLLSVETKEDYYKGQSVIGRLFSFGMVSADDKSPENKEFFEASPPSYWRDGNSVPLGIRLYVVNPEAAKQAIRAGESPPNASLAEPELAAYTLVANLILNLDETLTRN